MLKISINTPKWVGINKNNSYSIALKHFVNTIKLTNYNFTFFKDNKNVNIYFSPPNFILSKKSNYDIIYFFWETSNICKEWAYNLKKFDEVWVPCNISKNAVINSGYAGFISVIPMACEVLMSKSSRKFIKNKTPFLSNTKYKFYSIFEWHYRKGWDCMISSYFDSFESSDNVILYLKIQTIDNLYKSSKAGIEYEINKIKLKYKKKTPKIILNYNYLNYNDLMNIHKVCDCYVSSHRGEGWGFSIHEASLFNNSIISTKSGGFSEYLNESNSYIIKSSLSTVKNMDWAMGWYSENQLWAEPCKESLSNQMIKAYNDKGKKSLDCGKQFSYASVSKIINGRLYEIKNS